MANYRRRTLGEVQAHPPLEPLRGGMRMRKSRAAAVHATGDRVLSHGRQILARVGLGGAKTFHVGDGASGGASQTKPDKTTERVCVRTPPLALTPGHFPRVSIVYLPSGETETGPVGLAYPADGVKGEVVIDVTFDNGGTSAIRKTVELEGSKLDNGAQPTGDGAAWAALRTHTTAQIWPADLTAAATLAAWTQAAVTAEIVVSYVGSPRVVDLVVYEEPYALGVDLATGDWIAPMFSNSNGGNLGSWPGNLPVPVIKRGAADPGYGAEILCDAARRQCQELGPVLLYHTAWNEDAQSVSATETDYASITATSFIEVVHGVASLALAPPMTTPSWSTSGGAHAQRIQESEHVTVLRGRSATIPVRCYIYGAMSTAVGSPTATVRFDIASYNTVEVAVAAGTTYAWHSAPGFLRCGVGAQEAMTVQCRAKVTANAFRWRYIVVAFDGTI